METLAATTLRGARTRTRTHDDVELLSISGRNARRKVNRPGVCRGSIRWTPGAGQDGGYFSFLPRPVTSSHDQYLPCLIGRVARRPAATAGKARSRPSVPPNGVAAPSEVDGTDDERASDANLDDRGIRLMPLMRRERRRRIRWSCQDENVVEGQSNTLPTPEAKGGRRR